jgi:lipid II:glycine glycyltransferase (peptidoglycan interpeptide bridge formation enzyme)
MYSASLFRESNDGAFRNLIGRANRLLHWDDILFFKNKKYLIYDVGGISIDTTDKEKQAINKFKSCFGGDMVKEYKSFIPLSIKGWIYLILKKTAGRL